MKKLFSIILIVLFILGISGCENKPSKEEFGIKSDAIIKQLTRSGKLEEIYQTAYTNYTTPVTQYDDLSKIGAYINDITDGLNANDYPIDELITIMTSDEALENATKNGLDQKVAKGILTYLAVITPGTTIVDRFALNIKEFGLFFENADKYGLKDKSMKDFYHGLKNSNYSSNFNLGL